MLHFLVSTPYLSWQWSLLSLCTAFSNCLWHLIAVLVLTLAKDGQRVFRWAHCSDIPNDWASTTQYTWMTELPCLESKSDLLLLFLVHTHGLPLSPTVPTSFPSAPHISQLLSCWSGSFSFMPPPPTVLSVTSAFMGIWDADWTVFFLETASLSPPQCQESHNSPLGLSYYPILELLANVLTSSSCLRSSSPNLGCQWERLDQNFTAFSELWFLYL